MRERPPIFDLNHSSSPLARGLVFAGLGSGPGAGMYVDSSFARNHGLLTNMDPATDWCNTDIGPAILLSDNNDSITVPDAPSLNPTSELTLWTMCYPTDLTTPAYPSLFGKGWAQQFNLIADYSGGGAYAGNARAIVHIGGVRRDLTNGSAMVVNKWQSVAMVVRSGYQRLYHNGVGADPFSYTGAITVTANDLLIGDSSSQQSFAGYISSACIWNRALSPSEIAVLADPSNVNLSCGGVPLIREPRPMRNFIGQAGGGGAATFPWLWTRNSKVIGASA